MKICCIGIARPMAKAQAGVTPFVKRRKPKNIVSRQGQVRVRFLQTSQLASAASSRAGSAALNFKDIAQMRTERAQGVPFDPAAKVRLTGTCGALLDSSDIARDAKRPRS